MEYVEETYLPPQEVKMDAYDSYDELMEDSDREDGDYDPLNQVAFMPEQGLVKGALKPYRTAQYSCNDMNLFVQHGDIELEVEYQRDVVWPESRQEGLIDSLFLNYFIPPVLFAVKNLPDGTQKRVCMDGKQRLTAVSKFMTGQICWRPKSGEGKGKKFWFVFDPKVHKGLELPDREKRTFMMKMMQCAEFDDLTEDYEREIFQRVQLGMALTGAEKLQAISTPYSQFINVLLKKHVQAKDGLLEYFDDWKQDRGQAFGNIALMLHMVERYPDPATSVSPSVMMKWLRRVDPVEEHLRKKMDSVLLTYYEVVAKHKAESIGAVTNRVAPIEFSFIGLVIFALQPCYPLQDIARFIGDMRKHVREKEVNIRSNNQITGILYAWLASVPKKRMREVNQDEQPMSKRARQDRADGDYVGSGVAPDARKARGTRTRPNEE